ncbi:hypothetical protein ACQPXT_39480 [Streptomyces sp. CA-100214]
MANSLARRGIPRAFTTGCAAFAAATTALAFLDWPAVPTFLLVAAALAAGIVLIRRTSRTTDTAEAANPPGWDIPLRMAVATGVVLGIIALAPLIGPHLAGLLSPFPVFGLVMAVFTHRTHGPGAAAAVLDGLVMGLAAPAIFFLTLAITPLSACPPSPSLPSPPRPPPCSPSPTTPSPPPVKTSFLMAVRAA